MPETTQEVTTQEPDLDKMSLAELEALAAGEVKKEETSGTGADSVPPAASPQGQVPAGTPAPAAPAPAPSKDGWIEVDIDGTEKLRFKNQDEVLKSFAHAQKFIRQQKQTIDKYNAERGNVGDIQRQFDQMRAENTRLSSLIAQYTQGQQQQQFGQSPNAATAAFQTLARQQGQDPNSALYAEIEALKAAQAELATKAQRFETLEQQIEAQRAAEVVDNGVKALYSEVDGFLAKHPEFKPSTDFAKLDDLVSTYGAEAAQSMMSPEDYAKYSQIFEVVSLYKNGPSGLDLTRKNFQDLEEAFLVRQHRTGSLGQALANAAKQGMQNYEAVLNRTAQSAQILPNSIGSAQAPEMGPAEIEALLNLDPALIQADPKLLEQFNRAAAALGANI